MSADGVPPWARPVLEALRGLAYASTAASWNRVGAAITAALASDAGTEEGERVEGWTGKPGPCPNCGAIRNERDAHFCSSTRSAPAPLAEPDAELDRLISEYGRAHARATELLIWPNDTPQCRAAIHAHVERLVDEAEIRGRSAALAAPAPGDTSGETARYGDFTVGDPHLNQLLYAFANQWLNVGRAPNGAVAGGYDYSDRMATLGAIQRLYRAATGEVVSCAQVIPHWEDGDEYCPDVQILSGWLPTGDTQPYTVNLVRRREKEEG